MNRMMVCMAAAMSLFITASAQDENPLSEIRQTAGMTSIFRSWGFIGDSLASGEMEVFEPGNEKKVFKDMYEYSWGQFLCRLCGAEGENYSQGGQTAKGWITKVNSRTWAAAQLSPKQAYIIALGVNDLSGKARGLQRGDVGTDINLDDYEKNAETFAGYYAGIIQRVKSIQPDAKIFVVTRPRSGNGHDASADEWNDVIRSMADKFSNVYVLDLFRYAPVYDDDFRRAYFLNGHMSAAGYLQTAYMFATYIDWIIRKNPEDFRNVPLIGTPYLTDRP